MSSKTASPEKLQKKQAKIQNEIARLERERMKPKKGGYLAYLILIICLVYITDEIASQISGLMKTEIATSLFPNVDNAISKLDMIGLIAYPFQGLSLLYKPLADRFGRKIFLVINTLGMGIGLFLIYLSNNLVIYVVGATIAAFFVPHDMQVVYITESAPPKHRAKIYSVVKGVSTVGVMLIPLFRRMFMSEPSEWRAVYLIPAIFGIVAALVALFFLRETDAFIESRLRYLRMTEHEQENEINKDSSENVQGGFVAAMKFVVKHKQLCWLFTAVALSTIGVFVTMQYQPIITYGYAQAYLSDNPSVTLETARDFVSTNAVTLALFLFPLGSGLIQFSHGFISDKWGRKPAIVTMAATTVVSLVIFAFGAKNAWSPYVVGLFSGICVGSFWACTDINNMMVSESSPTNLRSSIVALSLFALGIGYIVTYCVGVPLINHFGDSSIVTVSLCLALPSQILSLIILISKAKETKGVRLENITGDEF